MIHIEKIKDKFFVNGKEVVDELSLTMSERVALRDFKKAIEEGKKIKSLTIKNRFKR